MKRMLVLALLIGLLPPYLFADDFGDFRIPRNTSHSWILYLGGSYDPSRRESSPNYESYKNYHGNINTSTAWGLDSDELSRYVSVSAQAQGSHYDQKHRQKTNDPNYDRNYMNKSRQNEMLEQWSVAGSCRRYPWSVPVGLEIGASLKGNYTQFWYNHIGDQSSMHISTGQSSRSISSSRRTTWSYSNDFSVVAAFGYGRVRNATSVYDVYLLEKRLLETGTLTKPLSAETRSKIASLYYGKGGFYSVHERWEKFFWRELERLLREDGALCAEGLDGYSLNRLNESYSQFGKITRQKGWFAGIVVSTAHERSINRTAETDARQYYYADTLNHENLEYLYSRSDYWNEGVSFGAKAEYHLPAGMRWQFDLNGQILFPISDELDHDLDIQTAVDACYLIADRWTIAASFEQSRKIWSSFTAYDKVCYDSWWVSYGLRLSYFIEDHVQIGLNMEEYQKVDNPSTWYLAGNNGHYERDTSISLSLTYRFLGAFDMPGLINSVRMLPFPK